MRCDTYILPLDGIGYKLVNMLKESSVYYQHSTDISSSFLRDIEYMYNECLTQMFDIIDCELDDYILSIVNMPNFAPFAHICFLNDERSKQIVRNAFKEIGIEMYRIVKKYIPDSYNHNVEVLLTKIAINHLVVSVHYRY